MCLMGSVLSMRACVRKCAGIPLSVKKMKGREQKVVFMREGLLWEREIKRDFTIYINKAVSYLSCQHSANIKLSNTPHSCLFTRHLPSASFSSTFLSPITVPLSDSLIIVFVFFLLSLTPTLKPHLFIYLFIYIYIYINTYLHPDRGGL